mgnify:CR=1 FL=1
MEGTFRQIEAWTRYSHRPSNLDEAPRAGRARNNFVPVAHVALSHDALLMRSLSVPVRGA